MVEVLFFRGSPATLPRCAVCGGYATWADKGGANICGGCHAWFCGVVVSYYESKTGEVVTKTPTEFGLMASRTFED